MTTRELKTVNAKYFVYLSAIADEGTIPTFEDCQNLEAFDARKSDRVTIKGNYTQNNLDYGFVKGDPFYSGKKLSVELYFPQTKQRGTWTLSDLNFNM